MHMLTHKSVWWAARCAILSIIMEEEEWLDPPSVLLPHTADPSCLSMLTFCFLSWALKMPCRMVKAQTRLGLMSWDRCCTPLFQALNSQLKPLKWRKGWRSEGLIRGGWWKGKGKRCSSDCHKCYSFNILLINLKRDYLFFFFSPSSTKSKCPDE